MSFLSSSLHYPSFPLVSFSCLQSQIHSSLWLHISQILFFGCALPTTLFSWCLLFISSQTRTCKSLAFFLYFLAKWKDLHITSIFLILSSQTQVLAYHLQLFLMLVLIPIVTNPIDR